MSARDELYAALSEGVKHAQLRQHHIDEYRAEVLREAADRLQRRADQLGAVWLRADQVIEALRQMAAASSSGTAAGDKQPETEVEYGVRVPADESGPADVLDPTMHRPDAEKRVDRYRRQWPDAVLVQRSVTYGQWTEATR